MVSSLRRFASLAPHIRIARVLAVLLFGLLGGGLKSAQASIGLVQHTGKDAGATTTSSLAFVSSNTAGNWIAVAVRGGNSSSQVFTVVDSNGNSYKQAAQVGFTGSAVTLAIYYAENIKAGANTVTVSDTVSGPLRFAISEYSGVATSNSVDVTAVATATSSSPNSGNLTTTASGDLLLAAIASTNTGTFTAGAGYTIRDFVPAEPSTKLVTEDQVQAAAGLVSAGASLTASDIWGAVLIAVKASSGGVAGTPASITATAGTPQSTTVNTAFATQLQVTVKDSFNNPVSNATVTFTAPASGASGTFAGAVATATTNAQGVATAAVFTANGTAGGPYTVTASVAGVATPANFSLTNLASGAPTISTLSLTQGPVGATLTVNGSNFGTTQVGSSVTFNGVAATAISNWSATSFNATVPTGATTGNVVVTVNGALSNGVLFTVTQPPNITTISPTSGPIGANVIITGTNFGPTVGTIQSFVTFNGSQTRASNWSDTSITAPVPPAATTGNVLVNVGGVPSNGVTFTVTPPPSIATLSPNFGPVGTSVTIAGSNFGSQGPSSSVSFNGIPATPTSWSATSIVVPVPTGATPGSVVVSIGGVASNGMTFTVTAATGNIALVQHTSVDAGAATTGSLAFKANNTAGNWIAVCIRAGSSSAQVFTLADSNGNSYRQAFQLGLTGNAVTFAIYYAENIKGGANTITVSDTVSGPLRFAILEYSGVAAANSLELTTTLQGSGTAPSSGSVTTTSSGDLLLSAIVTVSPAVFTAGTPYTIEEFVPVEPNTKLIVEDTLQSTAGTASASASLAATGSWGAGLVAIRSASGAGLPLSVSVSPTSASVPTGNGTQNFTASLVNDFGHQGVMWALSGAGCSGSTCGTLSSITSTSVIYNGPANVPNPATITLTATAVADNTKTATATITVTQGVLSVAVSPKRAAVTMSVSQTVQFTASVTNDPANAGVTWQVDGNNGGNATSGTVSTAGLFTPGTLPGQHIVTAVSVSNASVSASSTVAVTDLTAVLTYHNDNARTGQNLQEYALTTANVNSSTFGALFTCAVDGSLYAAPLYVANLTIGGQTRNVVYVATTHDSVYAFDADSPSCIHLWNTPGTGMVSFLSNGVTPVALADVNDVNSDMFPEIGVTSTPAIDLATNTIYVEAKTKDTVSPGCSTTTPCFFHHLHALDLLTGAEKFGGPALITASGFDSRIHHQRPGLLLDNGTVYIAFSSHGDRNSYQGWLFGYDAATLAQQFVTPVTGTPGNRGGVWQGGAGPAADATHSVYISTGNGQYDGNSNFGDTALKLSPAGAISDWFTPFNQSTFNANDIDLGSGGVLILPDSVASAAHPHLALATGKVAILYLLDIAPIDLQHPVRMGKFNANSNSDVQEVITCTTPSNCPNTTLLDGGNYGLPAYWNNNIYITGQNYPLSQFTIANGSATISTPQASKSNNTFPPRGATPVVSASGAANGIVWILDLSAWSTNGPAILDAYDATNVSNLLFSSPSSGPGVAGPAVKFTIPTPANGKVYVGGQKTLTVFGLSPN